MNKKVMKKILLGLSFIPYIIALICGILNCIAESKAHPNFDFYFDPFDLMIPLGEFYTEKIQTFDIPYILIFLFAIGYPLYFVVDLIIEKRKNKIAITSKYIYSNKLYTQNECKVGKSFIFFIATFLPYLWMTYGAIFGIQFFTMVYGMDAVFIIGIVGIVFPIFPIILIFQLIYGIKLRKNFSLLQKKIIKYVIIGIVASILLPSMIHSTIH